MNHFKLKNLDECYKYINELEKIIDTLKIAEKKYSNLFDSIKEGIFLTNMEGKILESNQMYLNMLGYTSEEIKELTNQQLTPEKWREMEANIVKNQIIARGYSDDYEKEYIKKDGTFFPIYIRLRIIKDINGNPIGIWGIVRDITELKQNKQELKYLGQILQDLNALIEYAPLAILLSDISGKILRANEKAKELLEYNDEILNYEISDFFDSKYQEIVKNHYNKGIYDISVPNQIEAKVITKNGKIIDVEIISNILKIEDYLIIQSFLFDVSERKNYEKQRELLLNKLSKSSQFKTEFLAQMSHELRTPLNAILGFTELLLEGSYGSLNEEQISFLRDIKSSADNQYDMIQQILDISKIESGIYELNPILFSLNDLINQIISTIKPLYIEKGLKLRIIGLNHVEKIIADSIKIRQILYNLLINAIKFTEKGEITLFFRKTKKDLIFLVKDTGIGIDKKDYQIIFKDFKRVNSPYVNSVPGTGLGLSLTKRLINLHGGQISFISKLGKGSTFKFNIPKSLPTRQSSIETFFSII